MKTRKPMVLILCTGNSCRSQMAEALLRRHHGERYEVASAGTLPRAAVHPMAIEVMKEIGLDLTDARPKGLDEFLGRAPVKHLLIVCDHAMGSCPRIWPGAFTRDYLPFFDPAEAQGTPQEVRAVFQRVRDEIDRAMREWSPAQADGRSASDAKR